MAEPRYDAPPGSRFTVAEQFETPAQQLEADQLGMWVFLATEALMFGGLFLGYAVCRSRFPDVFAAAAGKLDLRLGLINTAILLTSGLAMSLADPAVRAGRRRTVMALLGATLLLGTVFLGLKGHEYSKEYHEGLMPLFGLNFTYDGPEPRNAELFFNLYYVMTGLHALHMTVGLGAIALLSILVYRWKQPDRISRQVRFTGMYWAFVDIVWMLIFPMLYLMRG